MLKQKKMQLAVPSDSHQIIISCAKTIWDIDISYKQKTITACVKTIRPWSFLWHCSFAIDTRVIHMFLFKKTLRLQYITADLTPVWLVLSWSCNTDHSKKVQLIVIFTTNGNIKKNHQRSVCRKHINKDLWLYLIISSSSSILSVISHCFT